MLAVFEKTMSNTNLSGKVLSNIMDYYENIEKTELPK